MKFHFLITLSLFSFMILCAAERSVDVCPKELTSELKSFFKAVDKNSGNKVSHLINYNNVDVDSTDQHGLTGFHRAADKGHLDLAHYFLAKKASILHRNDLGETVLHILARNRDSDSARVKLRKIAITEAVLKEGARQLKIPARNYCMIPNNEKQSAIEIAQKSYNWAFLGVLSQVDGSGLWFMPTDLPKMIDDFRRLIVREQEELKKIDHAFQECQQVLK